MQKKHFWAISAPRGAPGGGAYGCVQRPFGATWVILGAIVGPKDRFWGAILDLKLLKIDAKINAQIDVEKVSKMMLKLSKNDANIWPESDQQSMQKSTRTRIENYQKT